jgi:hypothetical protein
MRAIHVIHPTSNPIRSPNASRVYEVCAARAVEVARRLREAQHEQPDGHPCEHDAHTLAPARIALRRRGSRYTPLPITSFTENATISHRDATRRRAGSVPGNVGCVVQDCGSAAMHGVDTVSDAWGRVCHSRASLPLPHLA